MSQGRPQDPDATTRANRLSDLEAVYREHQDFVWRTLFHLGVAHANIDDALQDVFLVVHRRLCDFDGRTSLKNWLYGVARRVASEYRRGRRSATRRLMVVQDPDEHASPPREIARVEAASMVHQFLRTLDEPKREVFVLAELEGMTAPEIAEILTLNVNTVYARLRAARARFDKAIARHSTIEKREHA